jgi:hypothetical protein
MASSKSARLRRRHAARARRQKALRKAGHIPAHTRTERQRAAVQRQAEREHQRRRAVHVRQAAGVTVLAVGVSAASYFGSPLPPAQPVAAHYQDYMAPRIQVWGEKAEPFHVELMDGQRGGPFGPAIATGGSVSVGQRGLHPSGGFSSWQLDGWERYRWYGPRPGSLD